MARLAVALVLLAGCAGPPDSSVSGADLYAELCASCHGPELGGGIGPALGAGSDAATRSDTYLETTITRGRGRMPAFGRLSPDQVQALIEFLRERQQP